MFVQHMPGTVAVSGNKRFTFGDLQKVDQHGKAKGQKVDFGQLSLSDWQNVKLSESRNAHLQGEPSLPQNVTTSDSQGLFKTTKGRLHSHGYDFE